VAQGTSLTILEIGGMKQMIRVEAMESGTIAWTVLVTVAVAVAIAAVVAAPMTMTMGTSREILSRNYQGRALTSTDIKQQPLFHTTSQF
jgi:hypothetical protein